MSLSVTNVGGNPQQPSIQADAYIPDQLIAGNLKLVTLPVTFATGQSLARGTVVGQVSIGTLTATPAAGTPNSAQATIGSATAAAGSPVGVYYITVQTAGATGQFRVEGPTGNFIGEGNVGTAFTSSTIGFTITDGGTHVVVGDVFKVTVTAAAGSGQWKTAVATATDGSATPKGIVVDTVDSTGGAVAGAIYVHGEFNQTALTMDASYTAATLEPLLRPIGIFLKSVVSASDPS